MKIVMESQWVGIDVSQAKLDIALRPAGRTWQIRNDESGWSELLSQLSAAVIALVVVESTGGMEWGVVQVLQQHDIAVAVINPKRTRDFSKAHRLVTFKFREIGIFVSHSSCRFERLFPKPPALPEISDLSKT